MTKQEFTERLRKGLSGLPQSDMEEHLAFYCEMIDDKLEEGVTEEEAVAELGDPETLAASIIAETPLTKLVKERITPRHKLAAWEIVLLVLGAPLWLPLLLAALAVVLSLYVALWAVILALWAVFAALLVCMLAGIVTCVVLLCRGHVLMGLAMLGGGLVCAGTGVLMFFACRAVTKGVCKLTKRIFIGNRKAAEKNKEA